MELVEIHPHAVRQDLSLWARTVVAKRTPAVGHIGAADCRHPTSPTSLPPTLNNY